MRKYWAYLIGSVAVVVIALVATVVVGNVPVLGLDLQGGVSVRLVPAGQVNQDSLNVAVDIIRNRVNGLGIPDADVSREGSNVVIDLPGVKDRDKARRLVGRTAELRFRPVLAELPPASKGTAPADDATKAAIASCDSNAISSLPSVPTTPAADDRADACVVLLNRAQEKQQIRYLLGPAALTGKDTSGAKSEFAQGQGYAVSLNLKGSGQDKFNQLAQESFPKQPPQNSVAIVLDGVVQSAPRFQTANFGSGPVQITGSFTQGQASDLANVLKYGALPIRFDESKQSVQSVSPTLGSDQLKSGIAAGIVGLVLVAAYMLLYYRLLGVVVLLGLGVSAAATYSLVSFLGQHGGGLGLQNITLTLAGVTGLIVSVGITVDSYVVYFERLKDEVRAGKTVRSSVDRGFTRAFKTIIAADLVSLIGAIVLYVLASGSVKGFAFFLGLATLLDLAVSYFFMHPLVVILSRRRALVRVPVVGIASGLDTREATA
ncbi:MAG TPA: protein translocase subunit SecD [Acidimicrobiia bacterium]|nr:protein translocase subunit SecD [Acidimicrobiia bacterium]